MLAMYHNIKCHKRLDSAIRFTAFFWCSGLCFLEEVRQDVGARTSPSPTQPQPQKTIAGAGFRDPCRDMNALRLLGYMDTLVHFGRFSLATLGKNEIDSSPLEN